MIRNFMLGLIAVLLALTGLAFTTQTADAQSPASMQVKNASDLYHSNTGNDQAFSIMCTTGHGPFWVQKMQTAWQKCLYGGRQTVSIDVPDNFSVTCLGGPGGFSIPGTNPPYSMPSGTYQCYTNHN